MLAFCRFHVRVHVVPCRTPIVHPPPGRQRGLHPACPLPVPSTPRTRALPCLQPRVVRLSYVCPQTDSEGRKFGKSVGGAIWLAPGKLSPYKFYQYLFQVGKRSLYGRDCTDTFLRVQLLSPFCGWDARTFDVGGRTLSAREGTKVNTAHQEPTPDCQCCRTSTARTGL